MGEPKPAILFVDDEPNIVQGLRRALASMRAEWSMEFAMGGPEALAILGRGSIDVIVSDMRMPDMNGAQLLAQVRERFPHTVRFILSGHAERDLVLQAVRTAHQYLAKPIDVATLKGKLVRALSLKQVLCSEELRAAASRVDVLPSDPEVVRKLVAKLDATVPDLDDIGGVISSDVSMSAKVLELVSSSYFGLPRPIPTPARAAAMMGHEVIRDLVRTAAFCAAPAAVLRELDLPAFGRHSLACARRARTFAEDRGLGAEVAEQAFVTGLLHDVGTLVLVAHDPAKYREVMEEAREAGVPDWEAERRCFGASHAEVGAYLLGLWGLPDTVVDAVARHCDPDGDCESAAPLLGAVRFAHRSLQSGAAMTVPSA